METKKIELIIVGGGGFAEEIISIINNINDINSDSYIEVIGYYDDNNKNMSSIHYLGKIEDFISEENVKINFFIAIGDNKQRKKIANKFMSKQNLKPYTIIHPTSILMNKTQIGNGVYIGPFSYIGVDVCIGDFSIVNTHSVVGHHVKIGNFAQVCPGAVLTGGSSMNDLSIIGSNASTYPKINIGSLSTLGSNSFATEDIDNVQISLGVPAKNIL